MFFYIDESGNTGNHLFEKSQPTLYYGVVGSALDLDDLLRDDIVRACELLKVGRVHASRIGLQGIQKILPILEEASEKCQTNFSLYEVDKADMAIITFFDQVFDPHSNPAVTWASYWTPLRYLLLLKLSRLFSPAMAKRAWKARLCRTEDESNAGLVKVCNELRDRVAGDTDRRFAEIVDGAMAWASHNPSEIGYFVGSGSRAAQTSPNLIGFQYVLSGIALARDGLNGEPQIVVDRQSEFNMGQTTLAEYYAALAGRVIPMGVGLPKFDTTNMPTGGLTFKASNASPGLVIADIQLWLMRRFDNLPSNLKAYMLSQISEGLTNRLSFSGIVERWSPFFETTLPEIHEFPAEQLAKGLELHSMMESKRLEALSALPHSIRPPLRKVP